MKKVLVPLLLSLLVLFGAVAAAEGNVLKFDQAVNTVFEGESVQTVLNRGGAPAEGVLSYESSNAAVLTVDDNGLVTGVSKGKATVTATVAAADGKIYRAKLTMTVARKAASIEVQESKLALYAADDPQVSGLLQAGGENLPVLLLPVKKSVTFQITVLPKDANNRKVVLSVEDDTVVRVKGSAVTGLAAGETVLTIASESNPEVTVRYRVLVVQPVTRISISASASTVNVGAQISLTAALQPENASIPGVTWKSEKEDVATVDANGVVTGVKRGTARIVATAVDGSNIRANISIRVTQSAQEIQLNESAITVDVNRTKVLKATVLPTNTDDKKVTWTSSDESIATVSNGRVKGISLGTCQITATSVSNGEVKAAATVTVQQPVTKITFDTPSVVFLGETGKLTWKVYPENASNPAVALASQNTSVLTVSEDGVITPVKVGEAYVRATSTDGSNRVTRVKVKVVAHVESVSMVRKVAYLDVGSSQTTGATILPKNAYNQYMTWESSDPSVVTVSGMTNRIKITGISKGDATITGTTDDGGKKATLQVKVGDFEGSIRLIDKETYVEGTDIRIGIRNVSDLNITSVTAEVTVTDANGDPVSCNSRNDGNVFTVRYTQPLAPGETSKQRYWKYVDFKLPESSLTSQYEVRITQFQIDNDWIKLVRQRYQQKKKCPVHI